MKFLLLFIATAIILSPVNSQRVFFGAVKIEFEKTVNVHATYKESDPQWYETVKDRLPKTVVTYHDFIGDSTKSIFRPGKELPTDPRSLYRPIADKNIVFTDFKTSKVISQKPIYDEIFLLEDSVLPIKWRITHDTRVIAGYECRKAIGILDDSLGIFAFYTDEIVITGGPEGIQGLPGMILGVGVPRLHTTWFASKVEVFNIPLAEMKPATKGKKVNRITMISSLEIIMRQWGEYGKKLITHFAI